jgi:hypothetical protein
MVSMQPTNQSYLAEEESCFLVPKRKVYRKASLMYALMQHSPVFAYLAQVAMLDDTLDSETFQGTVFAPCKEYCNKYWKVFNSSTVDHQRARDLVLSALLCAPMTQRDIYLEPDVDVPFNGYKTAVLPTLHRYNYIKAQVDPMTEHLLINKTLAITKGDLMCTNGILHLLTGLIEVENTI